MSRIGVHFIPPVIYYLSIKQSVSIIFEFILAFFVINMLPERLYRKQSYKMKSTKEEFLEILSDYQGILYKVSLVYFKNSTEREDNFQEIVYQLWKSYPQLKNKNSIGSWIYAVSINTSISRIKRATQIEYREVLPEVIDASNVIYEISRNESLELLLNAIDNLDEIDKSIMVLYLDEKSYDEIAEIIGISKSNVGVRINRAKEFLKQNVKNKSHGK